MDSKEKTIARAIKSYSHSYSGDDAWFRYVATFKGDLAGRPAWDERSDKDLFLSYFHDEDLAIVLSWHFGERAKAAIDWFESSLPVLDGAHPKDLWESGSDGLRALRSLIMMLPC